MIMISIIQKVKPSLVIFEPHDGTFLGGACLVLVKSLDFVLIRKVKVVLQCFGRRDS